MTFGKEKISELLKAYLRSRWHPALIRWPVLIVFVFLIYELLFGAPKRANLGIAMVWLLWWPLLPFVFLTAGRFWCGVCPFALVSDLVQATVGIKSKVPGFLRRHGVWVIDCMFIGLIFVEFLVGIILSPRATAILLLALATMAVLSGAFFERRTWCRYMCPIGGMASIFSRLGLIQLRVDTSQCSRCDKLSCYMGAEAAPGCPMFLCARMAAGDSTCNFCGNCIKNCPNDSISVEVRPPLQGLWKIARPRFEEALIAAVFVGIGLSLNIMLKKQNWVHGFLGFQNINISLPLFYGTLITLPCLVLYAAAYLASRITGQSTRTTFTQFGYFLVPLAFLNQAALATVHEMLGNGKLVFFNLLPLLNLPRPTQSPSFLGENVIRFIQMGCLAIGVSASVYVAYRIGRERYAKSGAWAAAAPFLVMMALILPFNAYFYLPSLAAHERVGPPTASPKPPAEGTATFTFKMPQPSEAPAAERVSILYGQRILTETASQLSDMTGNALSCSNCHFNAGLGDGGQNNGVSLVGAAAPFMQDKEHGLERLTAKVNHCFRVNLQGRPLPAADPRMKAITDYLIWISKDVPAQGRAPWLGLRSFDAPKAHEPAIGRELYSEKCAMCHRIDGSGTEGAPALWGNASFTTESPLNDPQRLTAFNCLTMPLGADPPLTLQEAVDVTTHILAQPRPPPPPAP